MVGMVVRDEDGLEVRRIEPGLVATREEIALADAAIHEHALARGGILDYGRVARGFRWPARAMQVVGS